MNNDTESRYVISVAARMIGVETHTLRYYERVGIIAPKRSRGNIRLYSEEDIALLRHVKSLMDELGVNLAGVEVILRILDHMNELNKKLEGLQQELAKLKETNL